MSNNKTVSYTADQIRERRKNEKRKDMFSRFAIYAVLLVLAWALWHSSEVALIGVLLAFAVEYTIWSVQNGAKHKRNEIKMRMFAIKRRLANQIVDADGVNIDVADTEYIYDKNGYAMTEGDINRLVIQIRDAKRMGRKGNRRIHELTKGIRGISRGELESLAKFMEYQDVAGDSSLSPDVPNAQDILLKKMRDRHPDFSKPSVSLVQYEEAIGNAHPEMVQEAARLGMQSSVKNVLIGNSYIDIAVFNHEGADVFGADNEGNLYISHGLRFKPASTDEVNEILDDLKRVSVP